MKKLIAFLLALVMLFSLAACGAQPDGSAETSKDTSAEKSEEKSGETSGTSAAAEPLKMQWYQAGGIDTLFESPWKDCQSILSFAVYEPLLAWNSDGTWEARLATGYTVSDDGLTYTFTLRDDALWHDGEPFTVDDAVWSFHKVCKAAQGVWSAGMASVVGYQEYVDGTADTISGLTTDGSKIIFTLAAADRVFVSNICNTRMLPKHRLENVADENLLTDEAFWSKPIGTGCYKIDTVSFPDYCTITAFEDYYGPQPGVKEMLFTNYNAGGNDAVTAALIAGDLDFAYGNAVNDIEVANNVNAQNSDVSPMLQVSTYNRYLGFNLSGREDGKDKEDLKNVKVRQAFNLLIDKEAFASFYNGQAVALTTFMNPDSAKYNTDIPRFQRNVDEAKKLLDEAGFDYSQVIDIAYYYDDQTTADAMAMLKQNFAEAGVNVNTSLMTGDLTSAIYEVKNYDLGYFSNGAPVDANIMYSYMTSTGGAAWMGAAEERGAIFDQPYSEWKGATDDAAAQELSNKLQALGLENCYMIPMYCLNTIQMYNTAKVSIPEDIFEVDTITPYRNWKFEQWSLCN